MAVVKAVVSAVPDRTAVSWVAQRGRRRGTSGTPCQIGSGALRFFVAPDTDDPRALFRFDGAGGSPERLVDGSWTSYPEALRFTMQGDLGADEIDDARAAWIAELLSSTR